MLNILLRKVKKYWFLISQQIFVTADRQEESYFIFYELIFFKELKTFVN